MKKSLLAACCLIALGNAAPPNYDVVIRGGRVLDGAGNPWFAADVGIKDSVITRVGHIPEAGKTEIDARGRYVSPGFIDVMDQSGEMVRKHGDAENKLRQGVTTIISGEAGTPVEASEIPAYFDAVQKSGIAVNFGIYYSAMQSRTKAMGRAAETDKSPTTAEKDVMREEVAKAMQAGVFGMSTALVYSPQNFQTAADLAYIAEPVGACGGLYASHIRDEGEHLVAAIEEAIAIGRGSGAKVEVYHLKAGFRPRFGKLMPEAIAAIEKARAEGVDVAADLYAYEAAGTGLNITVPTWVWADGQEKGRERLRDPAIRTRLKAEVAAGSQQKWSNFVYNAGGWSHIMLTNAHNDKYTRFEGMDFAAIGKALEMDPADAAWDILLAADPKYGASAAYFMMSDDDIALAYKQPWTSVGSDAGATPKLGETDEMGLSHPRAYGNFARVIAHFVREKHALTLEDAVRKMTSWPAARLGLGDRGLIKEGMRADIAVFDFDKVQDHSTYLKPLIPSTGFGDVLVNGQVTLKDGRFTGVHAGKVLRHTCS